MADHEKPPPYNCNYGAIPHGQEPPPPYPSNAGYQGQPPPQPMPQPYPAQQPPQTTTTIVTQPTILLNVVFREQPVSMVCPNCQTHVITSTSYKDGTITWLIAAGICLAGCWLGCCFIPFFIDGCKDVLHSCPNCHAHLGVYRRL